MKNLLFLIGILCILASCKKDHVEPMPSNNTTNPANVLPSFVYTTQSNDQNQTVYRFSYYPNGLVKRIIQYDSVYNPDHKDSTLYTYNANNQVIETSEYSDGNGEYKTEITYNNTGHIETVWLYNAATQLSITYQYIYAAPNDIAYVLKYNAANTVTDSIVIADNVILKYTKTNPGDFLYPSSVNGYAAYNPEHCFKTPNGVYYDMGVRSSGPDADEWGYIYNDNSLRPVCIDKTINFQYEIAEKFINVGGYTGFPARNFYITPEPRQYCVYYKDPMTAHLNNFKFDQDDRLIQITGRFDYYGRSGSPIPGNLITIIGY